jgi:hypothetical protein
MDTRGARELAKRLADEERRRNEPVGEPGGVDDTDAGGQPNESPQPDDGGLVAAVDHLQAEIGALRAELAGRDDTIARLRTELGELRAKTTAGADGSGEQPGDEPATGHVVFISGPSSYGLLARDGPAPGVGSKLVVSDWAEGSYSVCKVGPSPLPGDRRRCAFLERLP